MRYRRLILLWPLVILLAACQGRGGVGGNTLPGRAGDETINWPNDPNHIVFQIDVVGGAESIDQLNDIPLCTIYGDSRIVWTADSQPGQTVILFDSLDPVTVRDFVLDLVTNEQIYSYGSQAAAQLTGEERPVYEQIVLDVNDERHVTDGFENWPTDFFRDILDKCRNLSRQPALFEPTGGWLSGEYADYDPNATIITWSSEASGINLVQLVESDELLWVDNDVLPVLWNIMSNSPRNRLFEQDSEYFRLAFQVPNVHRQAPPAPTTEELAEARSLVPVE